MRKNGAENLNLVGIVYARKKLKTELQTLIQVEEWKEAPCRVAISNRPLGHGRRRGGNHRGSIGDHLGGRSRNRLERLLGNRLAVRAIPRDVASLRALIADLAGGAQGAAVGSRAVTGDVAQLATGIAFHGLGLAVTGKVVGTAALVARCGAGEAAVSATEAKSSATAATAALGSRAVALDN